MTIKTCDSNDEQQRWRCVGEQKYNIKQTHSKRYLNYGYHSIYVTTNETQSIEWIRNDTTGTGMDVCGKGEVEN